MKSSIIGQSVAVDVQKTSTGFEGELWIGLDTIVHARHMTMSELVFAIRSAAKATSPQPASPIFDPCRPVVAANALRTQQ